MDTPSVDKSKKKRKNLEEVSANTEEDTKTPKKSKKSKVPVVVSDISQGECDITNKLKKLRQLSGLEAGTPKKSQEMSLESVDKTISPRQLRKSIHIIPESEVRSAKKDRKPKEIMTESFEGSKKVKKTNENQLESVTPKKINKILDIPSESFEDSCSSAKKAKKCKEISQSVEECVTPMKTRNTKRLEGETATPDLDESIKKLLRSTEKTKRKLEKQKLDKKRKSVFNC